MPNHFIYPLYTGILAAAMILLVPRDIIRKLFLPAMTFGGVFNVVIITVVSKLLGVGGHTSHGPFGAFGLPFFPPFAWTIWFLMFFLFHAGKIGAIGLGI